MLKDIIIAFQSYYKAHKFIKQHRLWKWIIIPGILYCILFIISMWYFGKSANAFFDWVQVTTGIKKWQESINSGALNFFMAFAGVILWVIIMLLYFSLFKYVWLIVGSPLFAYLSEKTESILEGRDFPFSFKQLAKDIVRGISISLRNAFWQTVFLVFVALGSLIPVIGWPAPILTLFIECYYYGFSMLDYSMERHKKSMSESIYYINNHKGLAIGNGIVFYLMHWLPIVGWILAPAYAVIAATLSVYDLPGFKRNSER